MADLPRPPFAAELEPVLAEVNKALPPTITPDMIPLLRDGAAAPPVDELLEQAGIVHQDVTLTGHQGAEIAATVLHRRGRGGTGPGVYYTHGGGMFYGSRMTGINQVINWITASDVVVITPEYRLAPEFPDPYPVEDCYAGLLWTVEHAAELGIDPNRLLIAGASAGGGLAAGTALLARDRGGPSVLGQILIYPMLDDRDDTVSTAQIDGVGVWDRTSNRTGWSALLGDRRATDDVSIYAAPARATDLTGLPPTFIDCGSAEVFRDEDVAYATALWQAGVPTELHVWPGGFHGFDLFAPDSTLARAMTAARDAWVARLLTG